MTKIIDNFAVFIMVYGRPDKMWTAQSFRKAGYTGKIYYVADTSDKTLDGYRKKYGDDLLVFDKKKVGEEMNLDPGDNSGDLRSTLYPANAIQQLAKDLGYTYFMIACDDYTCVQLRTDKDQQYIAEPLNNMNKVLESILEFYINTPTTSIALAQGGDFIGGKNSQFTQENSLSRKAMNTFICSTNRPFKFMGRLNEDVTTYVNLGSKGQLFFTIPQVCIVQQVHQSEKAGLTDVYLDNGTYTKSFFSVMYNPSCVKVSELRGNTYSRIHHRVDWDTAVPVIISEELRKPRKS